MRGEFRAQHQPSSGLRESSLHSRSPLRPTTAVRSQVEQLRPVRRGGGRCVPAPGSRVVRPTPGSDCSAGGRTVPASVDVLDVAPVELVDGEVGSLLDSIGPCGSGGFSSSQPARTPASSRATAPTAARETRVVLMSGPPEIATAQTQWRGSKVSRNLGLPTPLTPGCGQTHGVTTICVITGSPATRTTVNSRARCCADFRVTRADTVAESTVCWVTRAASTTHRPPV